MRRRSRLSKFVLIRESRDEPLENEDVGSNLRNSTSPILCVARDSDSGYDVIKYILNDPFQTNRKMQSTFTWRRLKQHPETDPR